MTNYNFLGELSVFILSLVLLFNVIGSSSRKGRAHRLFELNCLLLSASTLTNILSVLCIENWQILPHALCTGVTTLYFYLLMASPFVMAFYGYMFMSLRKRHFKTAMAFLFIPLALTYIIITLNIKTGWLFYYDPAAGYTRGPLKNITYIATAYYGAYLLYNVNRNKRMLSKRLIEVFILYPVVSLLVSLIQFFKSGWIMTGTSAMATILLLFITIQADIMDYDITSGLPTERHFLKIFRNYLRMDFNMCLIHIENYGELEENLDEATLNGIFLPFGKRLVNSFGHHVYLVGHDRYIVLSRQKDLIQNNLPALCRDLSSTVTSDGRLIKVEVKSAMLTIPQDAHTYNQAMIILNRLLAEGVRGNSQDILVCDSNLTDKMEREDAIYQILQQELYVDSVNYQVYYQPIFDVKNNKFKYCECLSRLFDEKLGNISPAEFVPIAEKKGLIEKLGNVAFEKICKFMSENPDAIPAVTVNFSVFQLMNPDIVENVMSVINKYKLDTSRIIIEITESIIIDNFEVIQEKMLKFSEKGIVFYLDDFGTGYSNFANVVNLPFRTIKIDRSSMLMMEESPKVCNFFTSLIKFFQDQGLKTVVEGVETDIQDEMVRATGADFIQGFRYQRPLPEKEVLQVFSAN
ncbi:MAG: EAL domain-containing protein [Treponema sp.]|nr:EAL domain-containing protein [Treponema sp.]